MHWHRPMELASGRLARTNVYRVLIGGNAETGILRNVLGPQRLVLLALSDDRVTNGVVGCKQSLRAVHPLLHGLAGLSLKQFERIDCVLLFVAGVLTVVEDNGVNAI